MNALPMQQRSNEAKEKSPAVPKPWPSNSRGQGRKGTAIFASGNRGFKMQTMTFKPQAEQKPAYDALKLTTSEYTHLLTFGPTSAGQTTFTRTLVESQKQPSMQTKRGYDKPKPWPSKHA
ncbi:hypothetical protein AABC73_29135 (plasmid) [Pseudomonas sp. G.S.17]|uniref:hypothetical protein n=1 Tax=Pseudomonas sp. G.S.17 TaxID=3137451 RepID=UPI00311C9A76